MLCVDFGATRTKFLFSFSDKLWVLEAASSTAIWCEPALAAERLMGVCSLVGERDLETDFPVSRISRISQFPEHSVVPFMKMEMVVPPGGG